MSERIGVEITARDGASRVFAQVASGLDRMESRLEAAEQASARFSRTGQAMGTAIGATARVLSDASRISAEAQVSQERLGASIEATGRLYEEYADRIEAAGDAAVQMAFDDEEAADSISTLTQATGDASIAIEDLGLVMDVARGRGIGLAEATKIVAAAEQGRYGALARIGIQLDANATREEAIAALQQKYAGQAEAYARTNEAALERWGIELENVLERVGTSTGQFQELLMILPGVAAGISAVASAYGALWTAIGGAGALKGVTGALGGGGILGGAGVAGGGILGGLGLVGWMLANPEGAGISEDIPYFEIFQKEAAKLELTIGRLAESGNQYAASTGQQAGQIITDLTAMSSRFQELQFLKENPGDASAQQVRAWAHEMDLIGDELGQRFADNSAHYLTGLANDVNTITGYTGEGASLMQEQLAVLNAQFQSGWLSPSEYASQVDILASSVAYYDEQAAKGVKTTNELGEAMGTTSGYADAHAAGMERHAQLAEDVAQAQEDLATQMDATRFAYTGVIEAQAAGFRVAIQNTNAIASQSQAVEDWAENLIGAQGEYSKLDDLVNAGRITGQSGQFEGPSEYAAAQRAYNQILMDNAQIQEHIGTIQAKQAPLQALLLSQQEERLRQLSNASAEEQMLGLAYMDQATSMQALSLAQGLIEDRDVFGPMIEQMAEADPYLRAILEDLGLIAVDREGNVSINGVDDAKSDLDLLTEAIDALVQAQWIAMFGGDITAAEAAFEDATGKLVDWDNSEGTADINVNDNASGTLLYVTKLADGLDGRIITNYVNTVYGSSVATHQPSARLGGVMGYADGGVVIRAGEAGAERFDYPGGGSGMAWTDGLYNVPRGTYVHTAPATAMSTGNHGGITVHIHGNVYGIEELEDKLTDALVPALSTAMEINRRGQGG